MGTKTMSSITQNVRQPNQGDWPDLPLLGWADTCATLHLWTQIVGKIRLAHAPMINHWWQVPLYVTCRGLTTSPIPYGPESFQIDFDFVDHKLKLQTSKGEIETVALGPRTVADFYSEVMGRLQGLGLETRIWTMPVEIPDAIPFRARQNARILRPGLCPTVLDGPGSGRAGPHQVPRAIPRQSESGAFLLGQLRHGGYSLLWTHRTPVGEQLAEPGRLGHAGGVFA
jgi:hypothetical protein